MAQQIMSTIQKAFELNMDKEKYGTIAEIGAGQEVSRAFFRAGGAAGTVAKTISAYDMAFSDAIYGQEESRRYVTESRLNKMLDKEFRLVLERVGKTRSKNSKYFAFADTVTAKSYSQTGECHGWLGIRLQLAPQAEPSQILLHIRMLDESNLLQQEAVGILGVNLIYGAYHHYTDPEKLIRSLGDNLEWGRLEIDLIRFEGPEFESVDCRFMALKLVELSLADAVVFNADQETLIHPSELFYNKDIMVMRSNFKPITRVSEDMMDSGMEIFRRLPEVEKDTAIRVPEISVAQVRTENSVDMKEILDRVDCLNLLGFPVIVSSYLRYFRIRDYLGRYTSRKVAFVLGIPNLMTIFNPDYYQGHKGGMLGAFASLFDHDTVLIVYPMCCRNRPDEVVTAQTFHVNQSLKHFYYYLLENHMILPVEKYNNANMHIWPEDVLRQIRNGPGEWEKEVPAPVARQIMDKGLFGFNSGTGNA